MNMTRERLMHGYEVEWLASLPRDGFGGADWDAATYSTRDFASLVEARAYAQCLIDGGTLPVGSVGITEFVLEPIEPDCPRTGLTKTYRGHQEEVS